MNGLIKENIVFEVAYPTSSAFFAALRDLGFRVDLKFSSSARGYVSRVPGREPLQVGWSERLGYWYVLLPRFDTTMYCTRQYFTVCDISDTSRPVELHGSSLADVDFLRWFFD